ncbi:MAG: response regulator [Deinococcota bacterium]
MANITVIEDNKTIIFLIEAILEAQQHRVSVHSDGASGLLAMRESSPDLLILDVGLPDMSGFDIAEIMRDDVALADIPILMLTALSDVDSRVQGLQVADDYLTKPFEKREFVARIDALLRRSNRSGGLKGRLELIGGAGAAVQVVALVHPKGALIFDDGVVVYFNQGRVIHITYREQGLSAEEAVYKVFSRQHGGFRFEPSAKLPKPTIDLDPMAVLLEAARVDDETTEHARVQAENGHQPINTDAKGLTVVPNLMVAQTYIERLQGRQTFSAREQWDTKHNDTCVVFEGDVLILVALHSKLTDVPERLIKILK